MLFYVGQSYQPLRAFFNDQHIIFYPSRENIVDGYLRTFSSHLNDDNISAVLQDHKIFKHTVADTRSICGSMLSHTRRCIITTHTT